MTTSIKPIPTKSRRSTRLHLVEHPGRDVLDGGWWPRSRNLAVELGALVDDAPEALRIVRAHVSPPDWDSVPTRIRVADGWLEVDSLPPADAHVLLLAIAGESPRPLRLLVVPPGVTTGQGEEALLAAASRGNAHSPTDLLRTVTEFDDVDPKDHWR